MVSPHIALAWRRLLVEYNGCQFQMTEGKSDKDKYRLAYSLHEYLLKCKYASCGQDEAEQTKAREIFREAAKEFEGLSLIDPDNFKEIQVSHEARKRIEANASTFAGEALFKAEISEGDEAFAHYKYAFDQGMIVACFIALMRFRREDIDPKHVEMVFQTADKDDYRALELLVDLRPHLILTWDKEKQNYAPVVAKTAFCTGDLTESCELYEKAIKLYAERNISIPLRTLNDAATKYLRKKNYPRATQLIEQAMKSCNTISIGILQTAGNIYLESKDYPKCAKTYEAISNFYKKTSAFISIRSLETAAFAYLQNENYAKSAELYEEVMKVSENENKNIQAKTLAYAALANFKNENYQRAFELYDLFFVRKENTPQFKNLAAKLAPLTEYRKNLM